MSLLTRANPEQKRRDSLREELQQRDALREEYHRLAEQRAAIEARVKAGELTEKAHTVNDGRLSSVGDRLFKIDNSIPSQLISSASPQLRREFQTGIEDKSAANRRVAAARQAVTNARDSLGVARRRFEELNSDNWTESDRDRQARRFDDLEHSVAAAERELAAALSEQAAAAVRVEEARMRCIWED